MFNHRSKRCQISILVALLLLSFHADWAHAASATLEQQRTITGIIPEVESHGLNLQDLTTSVAVHASGKASGCDTASALDQRLDSATRSYIAWGNAMRLRNGLDSGTRSYIAWGRALERAKFTALDSGTRSYIAWGKVLEAKHYRLDSATRSYIAWGNALKAAHESGLRC